VSGIETTRIRIGRQSLKQGDFSVCELDWSTFRKENACLLVDHEPANTASPVFSSSAAEISLPPSKVGIKARQEYRIIISFEDVVVCSGIQESSLVQLAFE
jgi:hypothetical protein